MFEKEAEEYANENDICVCDEEYWSHNDIKQAFQDGAKFGYNKAKAELTERLENATEIIELMKDLFFQCWQEKGLNAIKFEQRVNNFLKEE